MDDHKRPIYVRHAKIIFFAYDPPKAFHIGRRIMWQKHEAIVLAFTPGMCYAEPHEPPPLNLTEDECIENSIRCGDGGLGSFLG